MTRSWSPGWRLLLVLGLASVPIWISGMARTTLGVSLEAGALLGALLAIGAGLVVWRRPGPPPVRASWLLAGLGLGVALGVFAVLRLWDPAVGGMTSSGGVDGIQHLQFRTSFVESQPAEYYGLIELYTFLHWVETLGGVDPFVAMRAILYGSIVACCLSTAVLLVVLDSGGPRFAAFVALLAAAAGMRVLDEFLLPFVGYYQAHGFHSQIFGLVPVLLASAGYGLATRRLVRLAWLLVGLVLCRFTYVLHAGDLGLTATLLTWVELRREPAHPRLALGALLAGLAATGFLYLRIWRIAFMFGGVQAADDRLLVFAGCGLGVLLLLGPAICRLMWLPLSAAAVRILRFTGLFATAGTLAQIAWLLTKQAPTYFFHKYALQRSLIGGLTLVVLAAYLVGGALRRALVERRTRLRIVLPLALFLAAAFATAGVGARAVAVYRPLYLERRSPAPRSASRLFAEPAVMRQIHEVLAQTGKPFGGLLTPSKLESLYVSAAFDGPGLWFVIDPGFAPPGSCVFWYPPATLTARGYAGVAPQQLDALRSLEGTGQCLEHDLALRPGTKGTLCYRCLAGTSTSIPLQPVPSVELRGFTGLINLGLWQYKRPRGRASVSLALDEAQGCRFSIWTQESAPYAVYFDGQPLSRGSADGHRYPLPDLTRGRHEIVLESPPRAPGAEWKAELGPQVRYMAVDCGEQLPAALEPPPPPKPFLR